MTDLVERAKEIVETQDTFAAIAHSADFARALIAADELVRAVVHEREMPCQDMGLQIEASSAVDAALATYRKAVEGE